MMLVDLQRQFELCEVYRQHLYRWRFEVSISLITQLLPKSIHAVTAAGLKY